MFGFQQIMTRYLQTSFSILLAFWPVSNAFGQYKWDTISNVICSCQKKLLQNGTQSSYRLFEQYNDHRKSKQLSPYFNNLLHEGDTIILMETYEIPPSGVLQTTYFASFWTKSLSPVISYVVIPTYSDKDNAIAYDYGIHDTLDLCIFPFPLRLMCEKWDIKQIKAEARRNKGETLCGPCLKVFVTKILLQPKGHVKIACFSFDDFYPQEEYHNYSPYR